MRLLILRFRAEIILGFAIVLAISAASLAFAYVGFERISTGVGSYRESVGEADLARTIDRELITYRALARYYVVTGKEGDAKAALDAEAALKAVIDQAGRNANSAGRRDSLNRLGRDFSEFAGTFAELLKVKRESALIVQNQLTRNANMLRYKLEDVASTAMAAAEGGIEASVKQAMSQF